MEDADFDFGFDDSVLEGNMSEYDKMIHDRKKWLNRSQFECPSCNETTFATGTPRCFNCGDSMVKFKTKREFKAFRDVHAKQFSFNPMRYKYNN